MNHHITMPPAINKPFRTVNAGESFPFIFVDTLVYVKASGTYDIKNIGGTKGLRLLVKNESEGDVTLTLSLSTSAMIPASGYAEFFWDKTKWNKMFDSSADPNQSTTVTGNYTVPPRMRTVNVDASSATIDLSNIRITDQITVRKMSVYNGSTVNITPPSGATFEGRASISLYGQYSYVILERISATLFAIRDLRDGNETAYNAWVARADGTLEQWGFKGPITSGATASVGLPRPYNASYHINLSGSVVPTGMWSSFKGYAQSVDSIIIYSDNSENTYRWRTIGKW